MTALLFLKPGAVEYHSKFAWPQPGAVRPGKWVKAEERPAKAGEIRAFLLPDAMRRIQAECYIVELRGRAHAAGESLVAREARLIKRLPWDKRKAVLFAADCAARVLPRFEEAYPKDDRPRKAVVAAWAWTRGGKLARAEAVAAHAAARAAGSHTRAACAARAAGHAAGTTHAAGHAGAAAHYAALAAGEAERAWQLRRLRRDLELPKGVG